MAVESHAVTPEQHAAMKAGTVPYTPGGEPVKPESDTEETPEVEPETTEAAATDATEATPADAAEKAKETVEAAGLDYGKLYSEFNDNGALSDDSRKAVLDALPGLPPEILDTYLLGLNAMRSQAETEAFALVGGKENYATLTEWAAENLSAAEIEEYNGAMDRGGEAVKFAIQGLHARMQGGSKAPAREPSLVHNASRTSGEPLIKSRREFVDKYVKDPRWERDAGFRASAEELLARSMQHPDYRKW